MKIGCPNCGANVEFMPSIQKFHCSHCGVDSDISQFESNQYDVDVEGANYQECTCSSCGAKLIVGENTTITRCIYCGSNQIMMNRFTGDFKPDWILPFKLNQEQFMNFYREFIKTKELAPDEFKNNPIISEIKGVYVPCYLYEIECDVKAEGKTHPYQSSKTNVDQSIIYFKTEYDFHYASLLDDSVKLNDYVMNSVKPYYFEHLQKFHPVYLNGFSSENGDKDLGELENRVKVLSGYEARAILYHRLKNDNEKSLVLDGTEINMKNNLTSRKYILVPVWFLNTMYQGTAYEFAVNGQTGKVVGNVPISRIKYNKFLILLLLLSLLPALLVLLLKIQMASILWSILRHLYNHKFDFNIPCVS